MMVYVAHRYEGNADNLNRAAEICRKLQLQHPENCYISPLHAFSYLNYNQIGYDKEMELCLDLLSVCDIIIIASEISEGVRREIELAEKLHMEVIYYDKC